MMSPSVYVFNLYTDTDTVQATFLLIWNINLGYVVFLSNLLVLNSFLSPSYVFCPVPLCQN